MSVEEDAAEAGLRRHLAARGVPRGEARRRAALARRRHEQEHARPAEGCRFCHRGLGTAGWA